MRKEGRIKDSGEKVLNYFLTVVPSARSTIFCEWLMKISDLKVAEVSHGVIFNVLIIFRCSGFFGHYCDDAMHLHV